MSTAASNGSIWPNVEASGAGSRKAGELSSSRKALAFATMCLGCFLASSDLLILVVSIQEIGGGLAASQVELSWVMTSYLTMEVAVIPLAAWLARCCRPAACCPCRPQVLPSPVCCAAWRGISAR